MPEAAAPCLSCHGAFGRPDNLEFPIIGGKSPFVQLLEAVHEVDGIERMPVAEAEAFYIFGAVDACQRSLSDILGWRKYDAGRIH